MDDAAKGMFAYTTEAVPILMQLILNFPQPLLAKELAALAINMSLNARNAELMCAQRGLQHLMDRVVETRDPNVSERAPHADSPQVRGCVPDAHVTAKQQSGASPMTT
jgi:Kinesin-associated protein (KAP)